MTDTRDDAKNSAEEGYGVNADELWAAISWLLDIAVFIDHHPRPDLPVKPHVGRFAKATVEAYQQCVERNRLEIDNHFNLRMRDKLAESLQIESLDEVKSLRESAIHEVELRYGYKLTEMQRSKVINCAVDAEAPASCIGPKEVAGYIAAKYLLPKGSSKSFSNLTKEISRYQSGFESGSLAEIPSELYLLTLFVRGLGIPQNQATVLTAAALKFGVIRDERNVFNRARD